MDFKMILESLNFKPNSLIEKYGVQLLFKPVRFKKNEIITNQGEIEKRVYHILNGTVRAFILNSKSEEETFELFCSGEFFTSYVSLKHHKPSGVTIQALSDVEAVYISRSKFESLKNNHKKFREGFIEVIENMFIKSMVRKIQLLEKKPEKMYLTLLEESPELAHTVPFKYLASYIGVTPQALSRIRGRIVQRNATS